MYKYPEFDLVEDFATEIRVGKTPDLKEYASRYKGKDLTGFIRYLEIIKEMHELPDIPAPPDLEVKVLNQICHLVKQKQKNNSQNS